MQTDLKKGTHKHILSFICLWKNQYPTCWCENGSFLSRAFHTHLPTTHPTHFLSISLCLLSFPSTLLSFDFDPFSRMFRDTSEKLILTGGAIWREKAIWQITRPWGGPLDTPLSFTLGQNRRPPSPHAHKVICVNFCLCCRNGTSRISIFVSPALQVNCLSDSAVMNIWFEKSWNGRKNEKSRSADLVFWEGLGSPCLT